MPNGKKLNIKATCDHCGKIGTHSHAKVKGGVWYAVYVYQQQKLCWQCIKKTGVV